MNIEKKRTDICLDPLKPLQNTRAFFFQTKSYIYRHFMGK
jgi:hypothetical protein